MAVRTQITLTNEQYLLLRRRAAESGASMSELIRRAVDGTYGEAPLDEDPLAASFGLWDDAQAEATVGARGPGVDERLRRLGL
jgi:hypothetical protein